MFSYIQIKLKPDGSKFIDKDKKIIAMNPIFR